MFQYSYRLQEVIATSRAGQQQNDVWEKLVQRLSSVVSVGAILTSIFLFTLGVEIPLVVATGVIGAVIAVFSLAGFVWQWLAVADSNESNGSVQMAKDQESDAKQRSLSPALRAGTNLAITVQGVVLGLVFAFLNQNTMTLTVKVGAVALGVGVIVGLLLYSLAAISVPGIRTQVAAVLLFNMTLWMLSYGLVCIIATIVARHAQI